MTKSKLRKLLTKPKFRAWLEAKKPRAGVGTPGDNEYCPIGRYLSNEISSGDVLVNLQAIRGGGVAILIPKWCRLFIDEVDFSMADKITASRALRILDGIK